MQQPQWQPPIPPAQPKRTGLKVALGCGGALVAGLALFGGCAAIVASNADSTTQAPAKPEPKPQPKPSTSGPTPKPPAEAEDTSDDMGDQPYLLALKMANLDTFKHKSDATLIKWGKHSCELRRSGKNSLEAADTLAAEEGGNVFAFSFLLGAAESQYCPDLAGKP